MACSKKIFLVFVFVLFFFIINCSSVNAEWTDEDMIDLTKMLQAINSNINGILNNSDDLNSISQDTLQELQNINLSTQQALLELQRLDEALYGTVSKNKLDIQFANNRKLNISSAGNYFVDGQDNWSFVPYDNAHSYELNITNNTGSPFVFQVALTVDNISGSLGNGIPALLLTDVTVPVGGTFTYLIDSNYQDVKYINFHISLSGLDLAIYRYDRNNDGILGNLQDMNEGIGNVNDNITNSDVNVDTSLPTNDTNDITISGFDSIFNTLYNAFTVKNSNDLVLPIPFTGKSITINYNNVFGGFAFGVLSNIISAFWFFVISLFIAKDIKDKINKIKSGNIEDVQTSNIKGDLL